MKKNSLKHSKPKIIFFGTPEFAVRILQTLAKSGIIPIAVVTAPDKPHGRGLTSLPSPVKVWASEFHIETLQPEKLRDEVFLNRIRILAPDIFVVASYGKIMPEELLAIPEYGTLNVHPSLLPRHRGPAPIEGAILASEEITGATIMLVDAEMDHGPILLQEKLPEKITGIKFTELEAMLAELGGRLLVEVIPRWLAGKIEPQEQNHTKATYTKKISKEDGHIDWQTTGAEIMRRVLALNPWPGTYSFFGCDGRKERLIVSVAQRSVGAECGAKQCGEIFTNDNKIFVRSVDTCLEILRVKPEGKREMSAADFLNGHPEIAGQILT